MFDNLNAFLRKKPSHLILHVGSNDASDKNLSPNDLFSRLIRLNTYAKYLVPGICVYFSGPIVRTDNNAANVKLTELNKMLENGGYTVISNDSITNVHLGKKGLHLNNLGVKMFAMNLKTFIRTL